MSGHPFRKTGQWLAALCCGAALCGPVRLAASSQVDTLVFRRDTISISRGLLYPGADTVAIYLKLDSLATPQVPAEEILQPLATDRPSVGPIAVPVRSGADSTALRPAAPAVSALRDSALRTPARVPTAAERIACGDSLHRAYDFDGALTQYRAALQLPDAGTAELLRRMEQAQNGLNLSETVASPVVIARQRFSLKDFFLFYPVRAGSWRQTPNVLDAGGHPLVGATYVPRDAKEVYFSAPDADGYHHLYMTADRDSAWSQPALLDERLLSGGHEIYPFLSPDGNRLYFASDAFYGVGGYDLYVSERDPERGGWKEPVNLGFPFSSPGDDFLLMDTPDGKYTLFASNRACRADSVYVYVLEQQKVPFRSAAHGPEELRRLGALSPMASATRIDAGSALLSDIPDNDNTRLYQERSADVSRLRDSVSVLERTLSILRGELAALASGGSAGASALTDIATAIARQEETLSDARTSLAEAVSSLQGIEKDFLRSGVQSRTRRAADREVVGAGSAYVFAKRTPGAHLKMRFAPAAAGQDTDLFRVMPVGRFAQPGTFPGGIVYQIYLFTSPRHATLDDIAGLSPVYERMTSSLKYTYAAGVFSTYSAALSNLAAVRRLGFPDATIVAFRDNIPIPVSEARRLGDR